MSVLKGHLGFDQGVDYDQSFSATLRSTSLRALLAVASQEHLSLDHFDVTSAFTQAEIDTLLYVEPPKGFPNLQKNDRGDDMVLCMVRNRRPAFGNLH